MTSPSSPEIKAPPREAINTVPPISEAVNWLKFLWYHVSLVRGFRRKIRALVTILDVIRERG